MPRIQLDTFTDRREAIALFDHVRGRNPNIPWPILPILTFIAPGGGGKSTLFEYLRVNKCCLPDGRAAVPYAFLDFNQVSAPKDLLSILVNVRDQLQQHEDAYGKHLTFPRFDLGALIAQAAPTQQDIASLLPNQVRSRLLAGQQFFESLSTVSSSLGLTVPYVAPLLAGLKLAGQVKPVQEILLYLENRSGWIWYRARGTETGIGANAGIKDVLLRLHTMSMPGKPEKDYLLEHLLPEAFLADLLDALGNSGNTHAWSKTANVILFFDGFEALLDSPEKTAIRLLEVLTCSDHRKHGITDPLLLVLGTRQHFLELAGINQDPPFEQRTKVQDEHEVQKNVRKLHEQWQLQLPKNNRFLRLKDLCIPFWLQDFDHDDTHSYLLEYGKREQTQAFTSDSLVRAIHQITHGHPLFVALAAAAVLEAEAHGRELNSDEFEQEKVSPEIDLGHEDERIRDYLLNLFLRQLSESERKDLIYCAVPRFLKATTLKVVLQLTTGIEAQDRWNRYRRLTFMRALDDERLVFHPLVRQLLLRQLSPSLDPESDFYRVHTLLRDHFHKRAGMLNPSTPQGAPNWQYQIEEAYLALALGDPKPAIELGIAAQKGSITIWSSLLEAVSEAHTEFIPSEIGAQAENALNLAQQHHYGEYSVVAIILYTWLLKAFPGDLQKAALMQNNLGIAYQNLPAGDRAANLKQAIACYEAALQVYTREAFPVEWATTQNNLGTAYQSLPTGDQEKDFKQAIVCYEAALQVYTREAFPMEWATTQNNLGEAYRNLPTGDRVANLKQAIAYYEAALQVYTQETFPVDWAMTQNNLGIAYSDLPTGDQHANLKQAIKCYQAALQVYTREAFPVEWATTQNNLGTAYSDLPTGDREKNLENAIAYYEAALQVRTREAFPVDWAMTQNNLGAAYQSLPAGDQHANLKQATKCYQAALQVYTREAFPVQWAMTQNNLGTAYKNLPTGDRAANLTQAISCYEAALQVRTREAFPRDWAMTQNNLGNAYQSLSAGDRAANLKQAIECYTNALKVYQETPKDNYVQEVKRNLEEAQVKLQEETQERNE